MMRFYCTIVFIAVLISLSCKEEKETTLDHSPMLEIMAIHDELMPKMGHIAQLEKKLESFDDPKSIEVAKELNDANEAMMSWMGLVAKDFDTEELLGRKPITEDKTNLINEYTKSVNELKTQMEGAIAHAQKLLEE